VIFDSGVEVFIGAGVKADVDIREWGHHGRQPCQKHRCADRAERAVHAPSEKWERSCERRAHHRVARQSGRHERSVRDDNVCKGGREDEVGARAERDRREHRYDPVRLTVRRECEPEECQGNQHSAHLPHQETEFCWRVLVMRVYVPAVPP
jgi:hypothetical protein